MVCAKLLLIVTDSDTRRRLLATWREFVIRQPSAYREAGPNAESSEGPVAFTRLTLREGLSLAVFVVEGAWRREYVCRVLAQEVDGFALLLGDSPLDLALGKGLWDLLSRRLSGIVVGTVPGSDETIRRTLGLPADVGIPFVDCDNRESVTRVVCELLEHVAAVPSG